jgi:hypothetical protein
VHEDEENKINILGAVSVFFIHSANIRWMPTTCQALFKELMAQ